MFISKTEINDSIPIQDITTSGYSPLLTKEQPLNRYGHGLGAYITDRFPYGRDTKKEDPYFLLTLAPILSFVFSVYHPQDDGIAIFDRIAKKIDDILSVHPSATTRIFREFYIRHKECRVPSRRSRSWLSIISYPL